MHTLLDQIERHARESGHRLQWTTVGTQMAHGTCIRCGSTLNVVFGSYSRTVGAAGFDAPCTGAAAVAAAEGPCVA